MNVRNIPIDGRANGAVHNANAQGVRRATASGAAYVLPGGTLHRRTFRSSRERRYVDDFDWTITGASITVKRGTIWLDTAAFTLPETELAITGATPCIAVQIHRTTKEILLVQIHDASTFRDGVGSDDTYFRLPLCTMTLAAGVIGNVRRLWRGGAYVAFSPA